MSSNGEIIHLHFGQAGIQIANACWELYCLEHGIDCAGCMHESSDDDSHRTFFAYSSTPKFVPRVVMVDSEPTVLDEIRTGAYGHLFRPDTLINGKEDSGSNFARGYYTLGSELVDLSMNSIRNIAEGCSNLKGFIALRSIGGGTGSGLGDRIMEDILEEYGKITKMDFNIFPSPSVSPLIVEPYNSLLGTHMGMDASDCTFILDNEALYDICETKLCVPSPTYTNLNRIVGQVISTLTASQRFYGSMNVSFTEFQTNLVPFPRIHFPIISYAPLSTICTAHYIQLSTEQLTLECFQPSSQLIRCNPTKGKYMSCVLLYRGNVLPIDINSSINVMKTKGGLKFVDWSPTGFKVGINAMPAYPVPGGDVGSTDRSMMALTNNTVIQKSWCRLLEKFNHLYQRRAFVHHFTSEGLEEEIFKEASEDICSLIGDYREAEGQNGDNESTDKSQPWRPQFKGFRSDSGSQSLRIRRESAEELIQSEKLKNENENETDVPQRHRNSHSSKEHSVISSKPKRLSIDPGEVKNVPNDSNGVASESIRPNCNRLKLPAIVIRGSCDWAQLCAKQEKRTSCTNDAVPRTPSQPDCNFYIDREPPCLSNADKCKEVDVENTFISKHENNVSETDKDADNSKSDDPSKRVTTINYVFNLSEGAYFCNESQLSNVCIEGQRDFDERSLSSRCCSSSKIRSNATFDAQDRTAPKHSTASPVLSCCNCTPCSTPFSGYSASCYEDAQRGYPYNAPSQFIRPFTANLSLEELQSRTKFSRKHSDEQFSKDTSRPLKTINSRKCIPLANTFDGRQIPERILLKKPSKYVTRIPVRCGNEFCHRSNEVKDDDLKTSAQKPHSLNKNQKVEALKNYLLRLPNGESKKAQQTLTFDSGISVTYYAAKRKSEKKTNTLNTTAEAESLSASSNERSTFKNYNDFCYVIGQETDLDSYCDLFQSLSKITVTKISSDENYDADSDFSC